LPWTFPGLKHNKGNKGEERETFVDRIAGESEVGGDLSGGTMWGGKKALGMLLWGESLILDKGSEQKTAE